MKNFTLSVLIFISLNSNSQSRSTQSFLGDVSVIELSSSGNVWIGSASNGCAGFTAATQTWGNFTTGNSTMRSDTVTCITLYAIGGVPHSFMGSTNGIGYKHGASWDTIAALVDRSVVDIARSAADHRLYVATQGGISVYNDTSLLHLTDYTTGGASLPNGNITCFHSKPLTAAGFYYGTSDSGYYYSPDGTNFTHKFSGNMSLSDDRVNCIYVNAAGTAEWIGTKNGYNECAGTCTNFTASPTSIHQNDVSAVDADCKGNAWVGTRDSGIAVYNHTTLMWQYITTAQGLPSNRITAINCKSSCECYVGTADGGAVIVDSLFAVSQLPTNINSLEQESMNVKVYPQPSSDILNFVLSEELKAGEVSLFDISGKKVLFQKINNAASFSVSVKDLEQGFYFYSIRNEKAVLKTGKISVLR